MNSSGESLPNELPQSELAVLLEALLEGRLSETQQARLNELLAGDPETRRSYVQYMTTLAGVRRYLKGKPAFLDGVNEPPAEGAATGSIPAPIAEASESGPAIVPPTITPPSPGVLGFIADCFRLGGDFVARPMVLMLVAAGLLAAVLFVVVPLVNRQPGGNSPAAPIADGTTKPDELVVIARITNSHSAQWQDGAMLPVGQSLLAVGQKLSLDSGLVEISFDNGARVLLEGPAELILDSPMHATLAHGQLTAEIPESAIGFTIQTPMVNVVDLGTKFGVRVSPKGMTDVAVFSGEVVASPRDAKVDSEEGIRVLADEVRRFWNGSTVDEEPLAPPEFTRSMPKRIEIANASFELPRMGGWMSREVEGWKIVSQPAWEGQPCGGVQLYSAERSQFPEPPEGQQWAFLESCKSADGVHRTSMYQAVAKLAPNTDYTLRVTLGREGFVPMVGERFCYSFSSLSGVEIGLWGGPARDGEPVEPLAMVRDPLPALKARMRDVATLTYRSPPELPAGEQWLFIRLGVGANDWCRVLFDDVQLEAVPVDQSVDETLTKD
jgi:hypothetical protein